MKKSEFAFLEKEKKKGNGVVIVIAVIALCIGGVLYVAKLQEDSRYITLEINDDSLSETDLNNYHL